MSSAPPQKFLIYFWSENGEFWCIIGGILCDLELQDSKLETRYRPGKSKGAVSPTLETRPHIKPCIHVIKGEVIALGYVLSGNISGQVVYDL